MTSIKPESARWLPAVLRCAACALFGAVSAAYSADLAPAEFSSTQPGPLSLVGSSAGGQPVRASNMQDRVSLERTLSTLETPSVETMLNILNIQQRGTGNSVSATQTSHGNVVNLQQSGGFNSAQLSQQGGNQLSLSQSGVGQRADIQQITGGPAIRVEQTGGASSIRAFQY